MKKLLLISCALFLAASLYAENKTVSFSVNPPLVCNNCEAKVKDNLRFEKGVKSVKPSAKKGYVEVTYDDAKTDLEGLKQGFKKIGYEATPIEQEPASEITVAPCCSNQ